MPVDHYENFPVASLLLPKPLRRPIEVIYAFARSADDISDEGDASCEVRLAQLGEYDRQLAAIAAGQALPPGLWTDLAQVIRHHQLPISLFSDLIDAFRQDVTQTRYQSFDELMDYCRRSANPIGRLLLHLTREDVPLNLVQSDLICSSLQLINHWQDVAIDWQKNTTADSKGRVYLPLDDLARFGYSVADIARAPTGASWQDLMRFQCQRARDMMLAGAPLAYRLRGRFGAELRLIVAGGLAILDRIDAVHGDVFRQRPRLGKFDWLRIAPTALLGWPRLAAPTHLADAPSST